MKKFGRFLAVAMAATMCLCGFASCKKSGEKAYRIGMSGPLTGGAALYGQAVKNAAEMAIEEINAAGGLNGVKFELIALDDEHDPTKVSTNFATMIDKGIHVSLGCVTTKPALEFRELAKEENLFFLTPSASGDAVPDGKNGFQMCFADSNQGKVAAVDYVNGSFKGQTIGALYRSDDDYSKGIFNKFKENLDSSITLKAATFTGDKPTSMESQVSQLKDCKFIFLPIYYDPAILFMTQAKGQVADDAIYYGCDGLDGIDSVVGFDIKTVPQEVSMLSHFNSKATEGKAKEFIDKYTAKFGKETLNQFGASAYDCVYAIYDAMKAAGDRINVDMSASDICKVLSAEFTGDFTFSGVTGTNIKWNSQGFVEKQAVRYTIKQADKK